MKSKNILVAAVLTLLPVAALAQQHIQQAFDALRQSKYQQETWTRRSVEKDPVTGRLEGLADVYDFLIETPSPRSHQLITAILHAFEQDEPAAYSVSRGTHGGAETFVSLAVGNSNAGGVAIGQMNGSTHIYACFLDPDDSLRRYRYAYALEWVEADGQLRGSIVKTYATTQRYREDAASKRRTFTVNGRTMNFSTSGGTLSLNVQEKSAETWLAEFNTFKNFFLETPDGTAGNSYATQIYTLCKGASSLDSAERSIVTTELMKLKKRTKDEFIRQLFDMAVERLKN